MRQDGGERAAGQAGRAARDPSALYASRALLPLQDKEKKKKESILDLSKYIDKTIRVKFQGGREGESPPPPRPKRFRVSDCRGRSGGRCLGTALSALLG